jgi:hypothetical protein
MIDSMFSNIIDSDPRHASVLGLSDPPKAETFILPRPFLGVLLWRGRSKVPNQWPAPCSHSLNLLRVR